jgi:pyrimidine-nucleoside phosphorylase
LIISSILSKKLSEGAQALVFDVKVGSGAFLPSFSQAKQLALALISISRKGGCPAVAVLSDMEQPLGHAVGNALEVKQAVQVLKGQGPDDFIELTLELAYWMLRLGGIQGSRSRLLRGLRENLSNGQALTRFSAFVKAQGGDPRVVDDPDAFLPRTAHQRDWVSPQAGTVMTLNARDVGWAAVELGAGRKTAEESVEPGAGIILHKKRGDRVKSGEPLATVYAQDRDRLERGWELIQQAYRIGSKRPPVRPLIRAVISEEP